MQDLREDERFVNLDVKRKVVYPSTLQHRRWLEMRKNEKFKKSTMHASAGSSDNKQTQTLSISEIESLLPPIRGGNAVFGAHMGHCNTYSQVLDDFYNGGDNFSKRQVGYKRAGVAEFKRLADSLFRIVGCAETRVRQKNRIDKYSRLST
ncbi:hypothetical protein DFQ26_004877 [Actinomortierella ambigua]|nr:hypothetical protein DFQ26_004877 [Actinomortierella ambigua]